MSIVVERVESATAEARALITALEDELSGQYELHQRHGLSIEQVFQPGIRFFVARVEGVAAGCGAIACDDGFAELKRMYVRREMRGRGVVQALLARLEAEARSQGYPRLTLETGDELHAAIKIYERAGFRRCGAFGAYATKPPHTIERSLFFEKRIG